MGKKKLRSTLVLNGDGKKNDDDDEDVTCSCGNTLCADNDDCPCDGDCDDDCDCTCDALDGYKAQPQPCMHPAFSHVNDPQDFDSAFSFLSLCMDPDDAEDVVDALQKRALKGKIEHYKPKDILRASKLDLLPANNPDVAQHLSMIKNNQKMGPTLLIRGQYDKKQRRLVIAAGYHRTCAAYYDDMNTAIPCIVVDGC